jgi:hypothetical protein
VPLPVWTKVPVGAADVVVVDPVTKDCEEVVVAEAVPGETGIIVPVQAAPTGQQATWLAPSAEQT